MNVYLYEQNIRGLPGRPGSLEIQDIVQMYDKKAINLVSNPCLVKEVLNVDFFLQI